MKIFNSLSALLLLACISSAAISQDHKITVQNVKEGKLVLIGFPGELVVDGYAGNDIVLSTDKDDKPSSRAAGLKAVYAGGTDNTGVGVAMEKNGNQVTLRCLLPITQSREYKIKVPDNFAVKVENECGHAGDLTLQNFKNEIEAKNCQAITLKNVTGPMVLSTISGDINVVIRDLAKDKPISIAAISGEVDLTLPAKAGADVEMSTISGNVYSDFDFNSSDKGIRQVGGGSIKSELNGGGVNVKITNISGNIYLRKSK
jgi:lia operon protein LiaG